MKLRWIASLIVLCCSFFTTGCWDLKELNNRAIVISSGLDTTDDGKFLLTDQFANPSALGRTEGRPPARFYTMSSTGNTLLQAAQLLQTRLPRYIFIGHRRNIFVGQETAEKGLKSIVDEFTRSPDSRIRTDLSIVKNGQGSDALIIPSLVEKLPSIAALKSRSVVGGGQPGTTFVDFLKASESKTTCPTLPLVEIKSHPQDFVADTGDKQIDFAGRAVFDKKLQMVGQINYAETVYRFWEISRLTHQTFAVQIPENDKFASVYANHMRSKIIPKLVNNHLTVSIFLKADGRIMENNSTMDLSKAASVRKVQMALNHQIQDGMFQLIQRIQREYHTDIFNFDRACQIYYPSVSSKLANKWPQIFSDANVHVYADIRIKTVGEAGPPLHEHIQM